MRLPCLGEPLGRPPLPSASGLRIFTPGHHLVAICWRDPASLDYDYAKGREIELGYNLIVFPHHSRRLLALASAIRFDIASTMIALVLIFVLMAICSGLRML